MSNTRRFWFGCVAALALFICSLSPVLSGDVTGEWDPQDIIPRVTIVGKASIREKFAARDARKKLVQNVRYWRDQGLPEPASLNGIVYIPNVSSLHILEVLAALNPEIVDIQAHVQAEFDQLANSRLAYAIEWLFEQGGPRGQAEVDRILNLVFSQYARLRYGYSTDNFYLDVMKNSALKESSLMRDNAYYSSQVTGDISTVFPKQPDKGPKPDWSKLISASGYEALHNPRTLEHRLVILPRSTQKSADIEVSSLKDVSVLAHELGHHLNQTLVGQKGDLPLMLDEALADYLAASPENNPQIGKFFAEASAKVAQRLRQRASLESDDIVMAAQLDRAAQKRLLRDLSETNTMADLHRLFWFDEAHTAADPIRTFVWRLHSNPAIDQREVNEALLKTVQEFSDLPMVKSFNTDIILGLRGNRLAFKLKLRESVGFIRATLQAGHPLSMDERVELFEKLKSELESKEKSQGPGLRRRAPIPSDYIVPEFLRAFFRTALRLKFVSLAEQVRREAAFVTNSESNLIVTSSGKTELVLTSAPIQGFLTEWKVSRILSGLAEIRDRPAERDATGEPLYSEKQVLKYEKLLDALQEYERTGSRLKLYFPHPVLDSLRKAGRIARRSMERALPLGGPGGVAVPTSCVALF